MALKVKDLAEILDKVQAQLESLSKRIERLESTAPKAAPAVAEAPVQAPKPAAPQPKPAKPEITEEEMLAISAALAAYLGVRVHIRQIRLLSSRAWAQQGRVSIQASHRLHN
jgi:methylmalonyl-CoA carboxyltransferase large subunit